MKLLILLFPILLTSCGKPTYVININKIQKCQTVINKKVEHKICKDEFFYECVHVDHGHHRAIQVFKKLQNANDYCKQQRIIINDMQTKTLKANK